MNEDSKRNFDAWTAMREHAWREFEDKARAEWRLSFGIWAALLASAGALIGASTISKPPAFKYGAPIILIVLIIAHAFFLRWIQRKLEGARKYLWEAQGQMRKCIDISYKQGQFERSPWWKQPSLIVQLMITVVLACVLWIVVSGLS